MIILSYRRRLHLDKEENVDMPTKTKWVRGTKKDGGKRKGQQFAFTNEWIPGYNPALLMKFRCHINVEYCGSIKAINYLYKYM
jgi:hypothetical protein